MNESRKLPETLIRCTAAMGFAFLAAHLLLVVADDVGLLRIVTQDLPLGSLSYYITERIVLCALLIFPALYVTDWLVKSRAQSIFIGIVATIAAVWLWPV